jgi:hypothetical protein
VAAALAFCPLQSHAQITLSTVPVWDGTDSVDGWGPSTAPTFGETFIAPVGATLLNDYTFYVANLPAQDEVGPFSFTAQGEVFNWTGNLIGGNAPQGTTGAALYSSAGFTVTGAYTFQAVTVTIPGGVAVTAGDAYVIDLTATADLFGNGSFANVGMASASHGGNDGGGGLAYNNGSSPVGTWDDSFDFGDLAFTADFNKPALVPDTGGSQWLLASGLAALACLRRRFAKS